LALTSVSVSDEGSFLLLVPVTSKKRSTEEEQSGEERVLGNGEAQPGRVGSWAVCCFLGAGS
jgi:hypothetical protein